MFQLKDDISVEILNLRIHAESRHLNLQKKAWYGTFLIVYWSKRQIFWLLFED